MSSIRSVKGMNDILPSDIANWHFVEDTARHVLESYGYAEIRPPIVEKTELFKRSIGEVTDIVEKEMYTFADRNGESLTMRPECTASVARACIQNSLLTNQTQRLWYRGPMFRYERPQKGRYRQFHQIGAEAFGMPGPHVDAELILLLGRLWREIGIGHVNLELNTLGTATARRAYRAKLVEYFQANASVLDGDSERRLESNPLRILDSKNPAMQDMIEKAPRLIDMIDSECRQHFDVLCQILSDAGLTYRLNTRLVRGLDYYSRTVFEWTTDKLGAQGTVCGGGRYDGLTEQLGAPATPGVGFSVGVERLIELKTATDEAVAKLTPHAYLLALGERPSNAAHPIAEQLRSAVDRLRITVDAEAGSAKAKFRRADRSGAAYAIVLGDDEVSSGELTIKPMLEAGGEQVRVSIENAVQLLSKAV